MSGGSMGLWIFAAMLVLMALRVPIAAAMFIPGAAGYWLMTNDMALLNLLKGSAVARLSVYELSVIPLFLLMGQFATQGGLEPGPVQGGGGLCGAQAWRASRWRPSWPRRPLARSVVPRSPPAPRSRRWRTAK